jgi:hypothetical protein
MSRRSGRQALKVDVQQLNSNVGSSAAGWTEALNDMFKRLQGDVFDDSIMILF